MLTNLCHTIPRHPISYPHAIPFGSQSADYTRFPSDSSVTPSMIKSAYGFPQGADFSSLRIACIGAFHNDSLQDDLEVFSKQFKFSPSSVNVVYPFGKSRFTNSRWIAESSLDIQWLCALCEGAGLYCVFSPTDELEFMFRAAMYAADELKCHIVLMSFGTGEYKSQSQISSYFASKTDVTFVAASGDEGGKVFFPASSGAVLAVGGSSAVISRKGVMLARESAWRFGGGGASAYEKIPQYQKIFSPINTLTNAMRGVPDVCFYAQNSPGAAVYISAPLTQNANVGGWTTMGATSFASVCLCSVCAHIISSSPKSYNGRINPYFYALAGGTKYDKPQFYFNDVVSGSNSRYSATVGWDFCTGLGSPVVSQLAKG